MNVFRLQSAQGINGQFDNKGRPIAGTFNTPTIEEYNNAIKQNSYVGRKIDENTDAVSAPSNPAANTSKENTNNKVEISPALVKGRAKQLKKIARAAAPKKKLSAREKTFNANNKAMVAKTKAVAKALKKQVKTGIVVIPAKPKAKLTKKVTKPIKKVAKVTNKKAAPVKKAAPKANAKAPKTKAKAKSKGKK